MFDPGFEPRRTGTQHGARGLTERTPAAASATFADPATGGVRPGRGSGPPGGPPCRRAQEVVGERTGAPHRVVEIVRAHGDDGRGHLRRRVVQQRPLGESQVRQPDGGELTGEPRLVAQPSDRVGAVGGLVDHRLERAAGPERSACALHHDVVTARRVQAGERQREREPTPVGPADQHGADRAGRGRRVMVGPHRRRAWASGPDGRCTRSSFAATAAAGPERCRRLGRGCAASRCGLGACRSHAHQVRTARTCNTASGRWPAAGWWTGSRPRGWSTPWSRTAPAAARRSWS